MSTQINTDEIMISTDKADEKEGFNKGAIIIYRSKDGKFALEVRLQKETVWISQQQASKLFQTERSVITKHLNNIFISRELDEKSNVQFLHIPFSLPGLLRG